MFIKPSWPVPANIRAFTTTRCLTEVGLSTGAYEGLNLGDHVGDDAAQVKRNRDWLNTSLDLPYSPIWLSQVHGTRVVNVAHAQQGDQADAQVAFNQGVCAVMTADCLPVLIADQRGRAIGAAHAGWRGLADGVLENTVDAMNEAPHKLYAWLGPAIGQQCFQVGEDVVTAFVSMQSDAEACFKRDTVEGKWLADMYGLATLRLQAMGVRHILGGEHCTYSEKSHFYSYRRDGVTGRMASMIWFA